MGTQLFWNKNTFTQGECAPPSGAQPYFYSALVVTDDPNVQSVADIDFSATFTNATAKRSDNTGDIQLGTQSANAFDVHLVPSLAGNGYYTDGATTKVFPYFLYANNFDASQLGGAQNAYAESDVALSFKVKGNATPIDAPIRFVTLNDVYMLDVDPAANNPPWLSADIRAFVVKQGASQARGAAAPFVDVSGNAITLGTDPYAFLSSLLAAMNGATADDSGLGTTGPKQVFESLSADEAASTVSYAQHDINNVAIFNFALARLRFQPNQPARGNPLQAFFRVFRTLNANLQYDNDAQHPIAANYRRVSTNNAVAAFGRDTTSGSVIDVPFYATARADDQKNQTPDNQITQALQAGRLTYYFGVVLDINQPTPTFPNPMLPIGNDDQFTVNANPNQNGLTVGGLLVAPHCCMVVEIFDEKNPVESPAGAFENPQNSQLLSQRNLSIESVTNYGDVHTRSVQHTFELVPFVASKKAKIARPHAHYDELLFLTKKMPKGTKVELFMPHVDLALAAEHVKHVHVKDKHRIEFTLHETKRIPVPLPRGQRTPALITMHLPSAHDVGEVYVLDVLQLDPSTGIVVGAFQIRTPIVKSRVALEEAFEREEEAHRKKSTPAGWESIHAEQKAFARAKLKAVAREVAKDYGSDAAREIRVTLDRVQVPIARKEPMPLVARVFDGGVLVATVPVVIPAGAPGTVTLSTLVYQGLGVEHLAVRLGRMSAGGFVELHKSAIDVRGDASTTVDPENPETWHVWYHLDRGKSLTR